jgi:hypothetical protein
VDPVSHAATISTTTNVTATQVSTVAASSTPTNVSTPVASNTPITVPTLAVTNTPVTVPTLAATNTPVSLPTLAPTSTAIVLPTWTSTNVPTATAAAASNSGPTMYNESNSAFSYSGKWSVVQDSQAYSGAFKLTQKLNSAVTLTFTGQTFTVIYKTGSAFGKMNVYVDGALVGTIDQYSASPMVQQKWSYNGTLTAGTHKLKLVYASPSNARVSLDAVSIP